MPSGLSNFFFFDGEKIAELALDNTNAQMKESIKNLLGISVLDTLENDLARIVSRIIKRSGSAHDSQELEALKEQQNRADGALRALDDHIGELNTRLGDTQKKLEKAEAYYKTHGGDIVAQQQELFNQRSYLSATIEQKQEQLIYLAAGELPLSLVSALLQRIQKQAEKEHESKTLEYALQKMRNLLNQYKLTSLRTPSDDVSISRFISYIEDQAKEEETPSVYNLSDLLAFNKEANASCFDRTQSE